MSIPAQHCARRWVKVGVDREKRFAATGIRVQLMDDVPETLRRIQMKSKKLCAVVAGSLVVLAMSLPVIAQETTQSTTTTTVAPDQPVTQTTQTDKTKTKYNRHHHVKETKTTDKTKTKTVPGPDHETQTTTTTTTPQP